MIVKTYYSGGRFCLFDTDHMTEALPMRGNMLTNWALDLDDVNGERLWLSCYYHEAADAYREPAGPKGLPVARRRDGWSFLIADDEDMKSLNRVTVDGELFLVRVCGQFVDATELSWAFTVADDVAYRSSIAHAHLKATMDGCDEAAICAAMGIDADTYRLLVSAQRQAGSGTEPSERF